MSAKAAENLTVSEGSESSASAASSNSGGWDGQPLTASEEPSDESGGGDVSGGEEDLSEDDFHSDVLEAFKEAGGKIKDENEGENQKPEDPNRKPAEQTTSQPAEKDSWEEERRRLTDENMRLQEKMKGLSPEAIQREREYQEEVKKATTEVNAKIKKIGLDEVLRGIPDDGLRSALGLHINDLYRRLGEYERSGKESEDARMNREMGSLAGEYNLNRDQQMTVMTVAFARKIPFNKAYEVVYGKPSKPEKPKSEFNTVKSRKTIASIPQPDEEIDDFKADVLAAAKLAKFN